MAGIYKLFVLCYLGSVGKNRETPSPALRRNASSTGISPRVFMGSWITTESSMIETLILLRMDSWRSGKINSVRGV